MKDRWTEQPTVVVFRVFQGAVIALFPFELADTRGNCESFEHVGQHGAADYYGVRDNSRPATPEEYRELKQELQREPYGYNLAVRVKRPSRRRPQP